MKTLYSLALFIFATIYVSYGQTTSPLETLEYCPNTQYTFTVSLPPGSTYTSMTSANGATITQYPLSGSGSVFNFSGRFQDANQSQTFTVNYSLNGPLVYTIPFTKIKSLTNGSPFARPNPTPTSIVAPRCQIQNFNISFAPVKFGNPFEVSQPGYGDIQSYEYLLPLNWKLGNVQSTGAWLAGGNNVTVTSDLSTGNGGTIQIRPINTQCGVGLAVGQAIQIPISRPEPQISITAPQGVIICAGGSANFTLGNIPVGATVLWTYTSNTGGVVSLVNRTSPTVTVNNINNGNARITLIGTVTDCISSYPRQIEVGLGTGVNTVSYTMLNVGCESNRAYFNANVIPVNGATNYAWYAKDLSTPNNPFVYKDGGFDFYNIDFPLGGSDRNYTVYVDVTTPCGNVTSNMGEGTFYAPSCSGGAGGARVAVSPNPTKNHVIITLLDKEGKLEKEKGKNILEIQISDKLGNKVLVRKLTTNQKIVDIDITNLKIDNYFIKIWNGESWLSSQISKK